MTDQFEGPPTWTLDEIKQKMHVWWPYTTEEQHDERVSAMWWLIRRVEALENQSSIFHANLSKSVQRRLDLQGVGPDAEKGKISFTEGRSVRQPGRSGRRSTYGRSGPRGPVETD